LIRYDIAVNRLFILLVGLSLLSYGGVSAWADPDSHAQDSRAQDRATGSPAAAGDQADGKNVATVDIPLEEPRPKVKVIVQLNVVQNLRAKDHFTLYPYPLQPPQAAPRLRVSALPVDDKSLKSTLFNLGYSMRVGQRLPCLLSGWRMNYCYEKALKNAHRGEPHTFGELYAWINEMLPYLKTEVLKSNEEELARGERWGAADAMFKNNRTDYETEALKQGLAPIDVRLRPILGHLRQGEVDVEKGQWWIVGTHKTPGLNFYWQEQVDLGQEFKAEQKKVRLDEANALLIEGTW
jgi:hypothetical protein